MSLAFGKYENKNSQAIRNFYCFPNVGKLDTKYFYENIHNFC